MKQLIVIVLCLVEALASLQGMAATRPDILVFTDPHLMAPALVSKQGQAVQALARSDMRMIVQSDAIVAELVRQALAAKPRLVLVTGDLTKDGELVSHKRFIAHLDKLRKAGIKVLVIPGNHDINSPYGRYYDGASTSPAQGVSPDEFARLYSNCGYGAGSRRDTASLSYACEPLPGYVVIGIDSNRYADNRLKSRGDSVDSRPSAGRIKASTLEWVCDQARQATAAGKHVIAMMHHHVVEHFDKEANFLSPYMVAHPESDRQQLLAAGIHTIFTGHLHVSDIARDYNSDRTDSITEVATGSLCTYPLHYRLVRLHGGKASITTRSIKQVPGCPDLQAQARAQVEQAVPDLVDGLARKGYKKLQGAMGHLSGIMGLLGGGTQLAASDPAPFLKIVHEQYDAVGKQAYLIFLEGNEGRNKQSKAVTSRLESGITGVLNASMPGMGGLLESIQGFIKENALPEFDNLLRSVMEDRNHCGTDREVVVDDLATTLPL